MDFIIRKADIQESDAAFELMKEAAVWLRDRGIDYWQNWLQPPQHHIDWILDGFRRGQFYFVESGDRLLGMYRLQYTDEHFWGKRTETAGYVHSFTTRRSEAGTGLGSRILRRIEKDLLDQGITLLRLDCGAEIRGLCAYYEGQGFQLVDTVRVEDFMLNLYEKQLATF